MRPRFEWDDEDVAIVFIGAMFMFMGSAVVGGMLGLSPTVLILIAGPVTWCFAAVAVRCVVFALRFLRWHYSPAGERYRELRDLQRRVELAETEARHQKELDRLNRRLERALDIEGILD